MSSLDRILPFLKPIEDLLVDPAVTEVMVNGGGRRPRRGTYQIDGGRTSWLKIKNPDYSQMEGRHELFAAKRAEWRPSGAKTTPPPSRPFELGPCDAVCVRAALCGCVAVYQGSHCERAAVASLARKRTVRK